MYNYNYYLSLEIEYWKLRQLRFYDAYIALAHIFGVNFSYIRHSVQDLRTPNETWDIDKQIESVRYYSQRIPNRVFEIGAGRGDLVCTLQNMGVPVDSCEVHPDTIEWFYRTGQHFFGAEFRPNLPIIGNIEDLDIDWKLYDTIVMVECIEHINELAFKKVWANIVKNFKGRFIVVNDMWFHPIEIGGDWKNAELEHCRQIDDLVYDEMSKDAKTVIFREGSHLVLEF